MPRRTSAATPLPPSEEQPPAPSRRIVLVSRHAGAVQWLRNVLQAPQAECVAHMDGTDALRRGDCVAGTLPLHIAAMLCARGVEVLGLDLPVSQAQRAQVFGADDMQRIGAHLTRYRVHAEPWHPCKSEAPGAT